MGGQSDFLIVFAMISLCSPFLTSLSLLSVAASSSSSSIYDVLGSHGLPTGILPKGITDFTIDPTTGRFEARLDEACEAKFETQVHYDWNISGTLGDFGEIRKLSGVSAQDLFLWFPVTGIRVDVPSSGLIYFDVGVLRKQFSLSSFETPPDCTATDPPSQIVQLVNLNGKVENQLDQRHAES